MNRESTHTINRIIRKKELCQLLGLSAPTLWRKVKSGDFPAPLQLGVNSIGWLESDISQWIETKKEALGKKQVELQRSYQDAQEELAKANEQEISKVVGEIQAAVREVAKERDLTFVFEKDRQTILYASDRIDISSDVVKILDKKKVAL
jgi:prophage regulatory protein